MLTALIASDNVTPLNVMSPERIKQALKFFDTQDKVEVIEYLNQPEEYPPYYWRYKADYLESSAALTSYAINDFMALG